MRKIIAFGFLFFFLIGSLSAQQTGLITWHSFEEGAKLVNETHKKMFIDIYTEWCGWCKKLDAATFPDTTIGRLMNKYFVAVKLDAERKDTVVFNGITFINPNPGVAKSTHQIANYFLRGRLMYPSMCFLNDTLTLMTTVQSFLKPNELEPILEYLGSDKCLTMKYDSFKLSYKIISGTTASIITTKKSLILNKLSFSSNQSVINKDAYPQLDSIVTVLKANTSLNIEIAGYTDNVGTESSNKALSESRAKAVYNYFSSNGIESKRMTYAGYGQLNPIGDNSTEKGRKQNRRVEIKFIAN